MCDKQTSVINITWEPVGNTDSQAHSRIPCNPYACKSLRSTGLSGKNDDDDDDNKGGDDANDKTTS